MLVTINHYHYRVLFLYGDPMGKTGYRQHVRPCTCRIFQVAGPEDKDGDLITEVTVRYKEDPKKVPYSKTGSRRLAFERAVKTFLPIAERYPSHESNRELRCFFYAVYNQRHHDQFDLGRYNRRLKARQERLQKQAA